MIVAEDAGRVAVGKRDLNGVVANRRCRLGARLRLKHRQRGGGSGSSGGDSALSYPLIIAGGAGTLFAEIREIVMTCVTVRPGNVDAGPAGYVNFYGGWFFAGIDWNGHDWSKVESQQFTVESRAKVWGHCINPTLNIKKPVKRGAGTAVPCPYNCGCLFRELAVAAVARGDRIAMLARLRMPEKTTDALIQLRADDVLELARLVVQFGVFDGERILK